MTLEAFPVLTIAIPTFNRAFYLNLNLQRLVEEHRSIPPGAVEILVSDNHSTDGTPEIVAKAIEQGLPVRYIRNERDIGSDLNIAQCFNEARGHYVQIMGDDDMYVRGTLAYLVKQLQGTEEYGVVCLRPFGYESDPESEFPGGRGRVQQYEDDMGGFLAAIGPYIAFISACVINKRVQAEIDAKQFCGSHLVQVHLVVHAALLCRKNVYLTDYILACKRNNTGGFDFAEVFVERLGRILDSYRPEGLTSRAIEQFETRMLISYHSFSLFRQRLAQEGDMRATYARFLTRFRNRLLFWCWIAPIILLPRPLALAWGAATTFIGRIAKGDLRRGIQFVWNKAFMRGTGRTAQT